MWKNIDEYIANVSPAVKSKEQLPFLPNRYFELRSRIVTAFDNVRDLENILNELSNLLEIMESEQKKVSTKEVIDLAMKASAKVEDSLLYFHPLAELSSADDAIRETENFIHLKKYASEGKMSKFLACARDTLEDFSSYHRQSSVFLEQSTFDIATCDDVPNRVKERLLQAKDLSSVDQYEMAAFSCFIGLEILLRTILKNMELSVKRKKTQLKLHELAFHEIIDFLPHLRWEDSDEQFLTKAESTFLIHLKEYRNDLAHLGESGGNLGGNRHYKRMMEQTAQHISMIWRRSNGGKRKAISTSSDLQPNQAL